MREKVEQRVRNLQQILNNLKQREADNLSLTDTDFYTVKRSFWPERNFWCSDTNCDCTEEDLASAYSSFYQSLGTGIMTNSMLSGFFTDLPKAGPNKYAKSRFRIIKEKSANSKQMMIPVITQSEGDYLVVKVKNTEEQIEKGLSAIRKYANKNNLQIGNDLWQYNIGIKIKRLGLAENSILAYKII